MKKHFLPLAPHPDTETNIKRVVVQIYTEWITFSPGTEIKFR